MLRAGKKLPIARRRARAGWCFIGIWVAGFALFFLWPLIQTMLYSLHDLKLASAGGLDWRALEGGAFANYSRAFLVDPDFLPKLTGSLGTTLTKTVTIVPFSLFIAIVLNQKFRGRLWMRAMFFLPVVITSGVIISVVRSSVNDVAQAGEAGTNLFNASMMISYLYQIGLPPSVVDTLGNIINNSVDVVWYSGVQVLLFLSGLLSIPESYREVANVEGATGWEYFWKIILPVISPYMLVNAVYTIIDSFSDFNNEVMRFVVDQTYVKGAFSYGAALAWLYFAAVLLLIGVVAWLLNRYIKKVL